MNQRIDKRRKFMTGIPRLNIDSLEFSLTVIEIYDNQEIGKFDVLMPNTFRIFGTEFEFHLN